MTDAPAANRPHQVQQKFNSFAYPVHALYTERDIFCAELIRTPPR